MIDFDFKKRVLVIFLTMLHVLIKKTSTVTSITIQPCFFTCLRILISSSRFHIQGLDHSTFTTGSWHLSCLRFQLIILLLQGCIWSILEFVVLKHWLELLFLSFVLLNLLLCLCSKSLESFHQSFDLFVLIIKLLHFELIALILLDIFLRHHSYLLLKFIQCWLLKRYSLSLISLLFSKLDILGLLLLLLHVLPLGIGHGSIHWLSLTWHWRTLYEFIMYGFNTLSKRRVLVPVFYDWTLVGDCSLIYIGVGDIRHHVNLRLHWRELISECDFYKKWPWGNWQHKWHSILLGLSSRVFHE